MTLSLLHGNALALPLADRSVHLIVTSPPYFSLRAYADGGETYDGQLGSETTPLHFLAALWAVMDECHRVLRDDGSCWVNLGDKFAGSGGHNNSGLAMRDTYDPRSAPGVTNKAAQRRIAADAQGLGRRAASRRTAPDRYNQNAGGLRSKSRMLLPHRFAEGLIDPDYRQWTEQRAGLTPTTKPPQWICRMDAVWSKPNGLPESVTDRVRASHENWFHFTKSERYYAALDEIREESENRSGLLSWQERKDSGHPMRYGEQSSSLIGTTGFAANPLGKLPGSVWTVATEPLTLPEFMVADHPGHLEPRWVMNRKDAWRWMRDTGIDTSPWPQQPEDGRQLRAAPSHFAAFPSYFPKRVIAGWSPSGVCTVCGEGRRPVCEKRLVSLRSGDLAGRAALNEEGSHGVDRRAGTHVSSESTITGYACACPTPTAPITPARVLDPFSGTGTASIVADALGRHGIGVDLSWDYVRIARWRSEDGGLRAKALGVEKPAKELEGQLSLLDEAG